MTTPPDQPLAEIQRWRCYTETDDKGFGYGSMGHSTQGDFVLADDCDAMVAERDAALAKVGEVESVVAVLCLYQDVANAAERLHAAINLAEENYDAWNGKKGTPPSHEVQQKLSAECVAADEGLTTALDRLRKVKLPDAKAERDHLAAELAGLRGVTESSCALVGVDYAAHRDESVAVIARQLARARGLLARCRGHVCSIAADDRNDYWENAAEVVRDIDAALSPPADRSGGAV